MPTIALARKARPMLRPLLDWTPTVELNNAQKRSLIRFFLAGTAAVLIKKIQDVINEKAEERYPDADDKPQKN